MLCLTCSLQLHFISLMMSTCQLSVRILHTKEPLGEGLRWLISWLSYLKWGCTVLLQTAARENEVQETYDGWVQLGGQQAKLIKHALLWTQIEECKVSKQSATQAEESIRIFIVIFFHSYDLKTLKCKSEYDYVILTFIFDASDIETFGFKTAFLTYSRKEVHKSKQDEYIQM